MARTSLWIGSLVAIAAIAAFFFLQEQLPSEVHSGFKVDSRTGVEYPVKASFSSKKSLELAGVGTRTKAGIVKVYSVGLYASAPDLKSAAGKAPEALQSSKGPKVAQLVFVMSVDEKKVADALSAVSGVKANVLAEFQDLILRGIGGKMSKGETLTLEFDGPSVAVAVRGKLVGKIKDKALADGVLELYLGKTSVSPTLKEDIRVVLAAA